MKYFKGGGAMLLKKVFTKQAIAFICFALFLLTSALPVLAAGQPADIISIEPGRDNMFDNMTDLKPGTVVTDYFKVQNISDRTCMFYIEAQSADASDFNYDDKKMSDSDLLLSLLDLKVTVHQAQSQEQIQDDGQIVYEGKASKNISKTRTGGAEVSLGELKAGEAVMIEVSIAVPRDLNNHFEFLQAKFWWSFSANEKVTKPKPPPPDPEIPVEPGPPITPPASSSRPVVPPASSSGATVPPQPGASSNGGGAIGGGIVPPPGGLTPPAGSSSRQVPRGEIVLGGEPTESETITSGPIMNIGGNEVPMFGQGRVWALLNLVLAIVCAAASVMLGVLIVGQRKDRLNKEADVVQEYSEEEVIQELASNRTPEQNKKVLAWRLVAILAGVLSPIVFTLTENMNYRMVFTDNWTLLMAAIAIFQLIFIFMARHTNRSIEEKEEVEELQ